VTLLSGSWDPTLHSDSAALSLTTVSSTVDRLSSGTSKQCACVGPPTYWVKFPSDSASARSISSSSSSLLSVRNGISSVRVRSSPKASAMTFNRLIEFKRRMGSSFLSSSLHMRTGETCLQQFPRARRAHQYCYWQQVAISIICCHTKLQGLYSSVLGETSMVDQAGLEGLVDDC
jgi:hypothetical protein